MKLKKKFAIRFCRRSGRFSLCCISDGWGNASSIPPSCCVLAVLGVVCPWQMLLCAATAARGAQRMQLVAPSFLHAENCHCRGTGEHVLPGFLPLPCYEQNASSWRKADFALWVRAGCKWSWVRAQLHSLCSYSFCTALKSDTRSWGTLSLHTPAVDTGVPLNTLNISSEYPESLLTPLLIMLVPLSAPHRWGSEVSRKLAFRHKMHREGECLLTVPSQCCPTHLWHLCQ